MSAISLSSASANADVWDHVPRVVHVPILMYHYISTPPADGDIYIKDLSVAPENFEAQVKWLADHHYTSITPDDLIAALWHGKHLPPNPVLLTFDDGYLNAYTSAFPILKKYGFTGTFFVITDWVDISKPGYLNWTMARQMVGAGMYIQDHSATHEDVKNRDHDWYVKEIVDSAKDIATQTGIMPRFFCYPFGGYDDVAIRELQDAGFVAGFTENDTRFEFAYNTMRLPRIRIRGSMTLETFSNTITDVNSPSTPIPTSTIAPTAAVKVSSIGS